LKLGTLKKKGYDTKMPEKDSKTAFKHSHPPSFSMICTYKTAKIKGGGIRNKAFI